MVDDKNFRCSADYKISETIDYCVLTQNQLLHFYTAVIRPVLEYAAPVWHHLINRTQAQQLESIQKRSIHIIYNITCGMFYPNVLFVAELESLQTRRNNLSRNKDGITYQPIKILFSGHLQTNLLSLPSHSTSARYLCDH